MKAENAKKIAGRNPDTGALSHEEKIYGISRVPGGNNFHVNRFVDPLPFSFNEFQDFSRNVGALNLN